MAKILAKITWVYFFAARAVRIHILCIHVYVYTLMYVCVYIIFCIYILTILLLKLFTIVCVSSVYVCLAVIWLYKTTVVKVVFILTFLQRFHSCYLLIFSCLYSCTISIVYFFLTCGVMCDHNDVTNACHNLIIVKCVNFRHSVKLLYIMMFVVRRILLVLFRLCMSSFLCSMSGMCIFVLCKMLSMCCRHWM